MSASDLAPRRRLRDFPVVFLSYDEPWADRNWLDLRSTFPQVVRVHGVKGLDACHKAAADAVPGDWVVTVDADTRVAPVLAEAQVPDHLLTGDFRLDWRARNVVNGLWSGNGSVKLWPKALIREMRTHEAAPEGTISLDHDINAIRQGKSVQVTMPERAAATDPAQTAFHAFRSGLRETAFFRSLAMQATERRGSGQWRDETELLRLIEIWCSIGRHAFNGRWMLYGARLGLVLPDLWPDWDPREVNDHDAIHRLWQGRVAPLFQRGPHRGLFETAWNWQALESGLRSLASEVAARGGPEIVELDAERSGQMARTPDFASPVRTARLDALGYRLMVGASTPATLAKARVKLEQAAILDHASAHLNMATLLGKLPHPETDRADWHLSAAAALGKEAAARRLADRPVAATTAAGLSVVVMGKAAPRKRQTAVGGQPVLVLDPDVTLLPSAERHVPDLALVADGTVLGYLALCPVTGLPRPRGIRLARPDRTGFPQDAFLPLVLARLPEPRDAMAALRGGLADAGRLVSPLLATLGRDHAYGDFWVLGALLGQIGQLPAEQEVQALTDASATDLAAEIARSAGTLSDRLGTEVPVWSAAESRAIKRLLPAVASRALWRSSAESLSVLGSAARSMANTLRETAAALWGDDLPAA